MGLIIYSEINIKPPGKLKIIFPKSKQGAASLT